MRKPSPSKFLKRALLCIPLAAAVAAAAAFSGGVAATPADAAGVPAPGKGGKVVWASFLRASGTR